MRQSIFVAWGLALVGLIACAPAPLPPPATFTAAAPSATAVEVTPEAILAPTRHAPLPESDIATLLPATQTVMADLATRTPTSTITPGGPPTATPDLLSDTAFDTTTEHSTSPDGLWVATSIRSFPRPEYLEDYHFYYNQLSAERTDGSVRWIIADEWSELAVGYDWLTFYRWSDKGSYLYYTHKVVPDGCAAMFSNGWDLYRFDLRDGASEEIIPAYSAWYIALSPDGTLVAYSSYLGITMRTIDTGQERIAPLPEPIRFNAGAIHWAPDQSAIVLSAVDNPCSPEPLHTILRVDRATLQVVSLLADTRQRLVTVGWPELGRILLREMGHGWDWTNQYYWMHPVTGEIAPHE